MESAKARIEAAEPRIFGGARNALYAVELGPTGYLALVLISVGITSGAIYRRYEKRATVSIELTTFPSTIMPYTIHLAPDGVVG